MFISFRSSRTTNNCTNHHAACAPKWRLPVICVILITRVNSSILCTLGQTSPYLKLCTEGSPFVVESIHCFCCWQAKRLGIFTRQTAVFSGYVGIRCEQVAAEMAQSKLYYTESEAKAIIEDLGEKRFSILKIGYFDPTAVLSKVTFTIDQTKRIVLGKSMFCIEAATLMGQQTDFPGKEALEHFLTVLPTLDPADISHGSTEATTFINIAENLLAKISQRVTLSKDQYDTLMKRDPPYVPPDEELLSDTPNVSPCTELAVEYIGIGTLDTWHGTPDARLRAYQTPSEIAVLRGVASNVSPAHSSGDNVIIEAKLDTDNINRQQLIATTVVSSFIERNLHPDANPLVPVILITIPTTQICLYDSTTDLLLISDVLEWINVENNTFNVVNLFLIWVFIHHRFFLKRISLISQRNQDEQASTIQAKLAAMGSSLNNFRGLYVKNSRFIGNRKKRHGTDEEEVSVINMSSEQPPPLKKRPTI